MLNDIKMFLNSDIIKNYIKENQLASKFYFSINYKNDIKSFKIYFDTKSDLYLKVFSSELYNRIKHFYPISSEIITSIKQNNSNFFKYIHFKFNKSVKVFDTSLVSLFPINQKEIKQGLTVDKNNKKVNFRRYFYINDLKNKELLSKLFKVNMISAKELEYTEADDYYKVIALENKNSHNIIRLNEYAYKDIHILEDFFEKPCSHSGLYKDNIVSIYFCGLDCLEKLKTLQ